MAMKKPWLAVVLNLIPGLGYLYLNTRKVFAWLLLAYMMACIASTIELWGVTDLPFIAWDFLSMCAYTAAFLFDAYFEAKRINASAEEKSSSTKTEK